MNNLTQPGGTPASRLLIDEPPLVLLPTLAVIIGDRRAIALQQIHYWLDLNRKAETKSGKPFHFRDGRWWTYNTYQQWHDDCFPFWTTRLIRKLFTELESMSLVVSAQFDQSKGNSTKWYSIDYDKLNTLEKKHREATTQNDGRVSESVTGVSESVSPYTETTSETNDQETIKTKISDASFAPSGGDFFEGSIAMRDGGGTDQPSHGPDQRTRSVAPQPKAKWDTQKDGLAHDRHGWLKLPSTSSVVANQRGRVSQAKAIAVRQAQLWLIEQGIREVEIVGGEDGGDWIEHLGGCDPIDVALGKDGDLPLQKLRTLAFDQGLIDQDEFNEVLREAFWDAVYDLI